MTQSYAEVESVVLIAHLLLRLVFVSLAPNTLREEVLPVKAQAALCAILLMKVDEILPQGRALLCTQAFRQ